MSARLIAAAHAMLETLAEVMERIPPDAWRRIDTAADELGAAVEACESAPVHDIDIIAQSDRSVLKVIAGEPVYLQSDGRQVWRGLIIGVRDPAQVHLIGTLA